MPNIFDFPRAELPESGGAEERSFYNPLIAGSSEDSFLPTELKSPDTVSVKPDSFPPNALASPSSIGEPPCGLATDPIGGSAATFIGFSAGAGAAGGVFLRAVLGFGGDLAVALGAAGFEPAGMPLDSNATSGASR